MKPARIVGPRVLDPELASVLLAVALAGLLALRSVLGKRTCDRD